MFNLLPRDTVFYDLFEGMSRHVVRSAEDLRQLGAELSRYYPAHPTNSRRGARGRRAGPPGVTTDRLDRTFITPFDREDIHALVGELDDIIDTVDALAKRFPLFHVKQMEPMFLRQTEVLVAASVKLDEAVHRLRRSRKLSELSDVLIDIHHHGASVGDDNHHRGDVTPLPRRYRCGWKS